ncbi:5' exonuclease Apollo-like isoform X2 [Zingiber officinale]|uniref:5' exonuclease Apollo-like isoform X2 n=1 Tax=Zingiber officinale TaxID=94328 RepID=UPI001C4B4577|nr:5' exonuclease Apollo-like isoform X2 [Zingiber officinale]
MEKGIVSIDRWNEGSQAYFLTHLHDDHTAGLSASWRRGPLFCSPITASLLPFRFRGFDVSLLRVIEVGATRALDLVSPTSGAPVRVLVTPIDAHHCPGALMYLFHGTFGWVLYTGDFRWELSSERSQLAKRMLLDVLQGNAIDVLYMDNTYCNPSFSFPPREVATKQVIDIIVTHPDHDIVIGIDNLGKEELLVNISKALNIKIRVWPERLRTMHLLGYKDVFTTNTSLTRVRAIPRYSFTFETIDGLNQLHPTIGIMPSGLPWLLDASKNTTLYASPLKSHQSEASPDLLQDMPHARKLKHNAYCVPYSEHSCFSEIAEFIKSCRPISL